MYKDKKQKENESLHNVIQTLIDKSNAILYEKPLYKIIIARIKRFTKKLTKKG